MMDNQINIFLLPPEVCSTPKNSVLGWILAHVANNFHTVGDEYHWSSGTEKLHQQRVSDQCSTHFDTCAAGRNSWQIVWITSVEFRESGILYGKSYLLDLVFTHNSKTPLTYPLVVRKMIDAVCYG